ncbi:hypothetical protein ACWCQL_19640 [Streptomyces sp. NPDC002073]|uniref:hypothetical protein n=1 Tax=Streptomyces sp. NBC_00239 TaxID=2903640 RepID=UPI002E2A4BDD|nr:hypothetical protein [Streptomyces sp. NBC_00239]
MGSLRNPVGPLPSSIYWRRRAVLASVAALLAMLAVWAVSSGGGTGVSDAKGPGRNDGQGGSIAPGPDPSGSAISQYPGGRDESGAGGTGGDHGDTSAGTGASGGTGTGTGPDAGGGKNGEPGGTPAGGGSDGGTQVPANSPVPTCAPGAVRWKVESAKIAYELTDTPRFDLVATNTSGTTCKVDLGPRTAVLTITKTDADKPLWSSADCPAGAGSVYFRVPAGSEVTHAIAWNRKASAARCATPPPGAAPAGTYLVEVKAEGLPVLRASFRLNQD